MHPAVRAQQSLQDSPHCAGLEPSASTWQGHRAQTQPCLEAAVAVERPLALLPGLCLTAHHTDCLPALPGR